MNVRLDGSSPPACANDHGPVPPDAVSVAVYGWLSVPSGSYSMGHLSKLLEQLEPRQQVMFFKKLKETSPESLKVFAPLYYGFMSEFSELLFT